MSENERNRKIYEWARRHLKKRVGRGECWDLADRALRDSGARSSTTIGGKDDYVWGAKVALGAVIPGDILQFREHVEKTIVVTETVYGDGEVETNERYSSELRPHHTAVVAANKGSKGLEIFEQNQPRGAPVRLVTLHVASGTKKVETKSRAIRGKDGRMRHATIKETTSVHVSGWIWAYRPQANQ